MLTGLLLGVGLAAAAPDTDQRRLLYDALLAEAADGRIEPLQDAARALPSDAPARGQALKWLGYSLWLRGDLDGARRALVDGIRSGYCPGDCRDLLNEVELEQYAVREIPMAWTFDDPDHGIVHRWRLQGALRLERGERRLRWSVPANPRPEDVLEVGFATGGTAVDTIALKLLVTRDAVFQAVVTDVEGRRHRLPGGRPLVRNTPTTVLLRPSDFVPVDGGEPLDPTELHRMVFGDPSPGPAREMVVSRFEVR